MANPDKHSLNTDTVLRDEDESVAGLTLSRRVTLADDGMLRQELKLKNGQGLLTSNSSWLIQTEGHAEDCMNALDIHWRKAREEFTDIVLHTRQYTSLKTNHDRQDIRTAMDYAIAELISKLTRQYASDDEIRDGVPPDETPFVPYSDRLYMIREAAFKGQVEFDAFESTLFNLHDSVQLAAEHYGHVIKSRSGTWDGDDDDDYDDDDDDDEHWLDTSFKPADDYNLSADAMDTYRRNVDRFFMATEAIWLETAAQIREGLPVNVDSQQLAAMKYWMEETKSSYEELKDALRSEGLGDAAMWSVYEVLEHPQQGTLPCMRRAVSIASRPELLKDAISKMLTKDQPDISI